MYGFQNLYLQLKKKLGSRALFQNIKMKLKVVALALMIMMGGQTVAPSSSYAFTSAQEYVNNVTWGSSYSNNWNVCLNPFNILNPFDMLFFYTVDLPTSLPPSSHSSTGAQTLDFLFASTMANIAFQAYTIALNPAYYLMSVGYPLWALIDTCTNTFIMQPHEYVNYANNWVTVQNKKNINPCAVTADDVPYYFQCDTPGAYGYSKDLCYDKPVGNYDPGLCTCVPGTSAVPTIRPASFCLARPNLLGKIIIGYDGPLGSHSGSAFKPATTYTLDPRNINQRSTMSQMAMILYSYFKQSPMMGGVEACVASPTTIPPVLVGCAPVTPPNTPSPSINTSYNNTRCAYITSSRSDLVSLSSALGEVDGIGHHALSVKRFLLGNIHFTSNAVGCIKDVLIKVITPYYDGTGYSALSSSQTMLRPIIYAMLVLYVALVGIKIMTSAASLKRGEYIMFLVKLALVTYFVTPVAWYQVTANGVTGLVQALIFGGDQIASFMTDALNAGDPVGMCRYQMPDGTQLLTERMVPSPSSNTAGYVGVKLTIWDLFDCKLANYLSLGSCNYTLKGMMVVWIISLTMSFSIISIPLAVVMIIYMWVMVKILLKLVYIFLMSAFISTVLIIISPIFIALSLFTFTKGMFEVWMRKLFAYMIYPALLTGAMCLILATLDSIFNGGITMPTPSPSISESRQLMTACAGNNGIFCQTVNYVGSDTCSSSIGMIMNKLTHVTTIAIGPLKWHQRSLKTGVIVSYFQTMIPLMLVAFLLVTLLDTIVSAIESIAGAIGVSQAISKQTMLGKAASEAMSQVTAKIGGQVFKKIMDSIKGKKRSGLGS